MNSPGSSEPAALGPTPEEMAEALEATGNYKVLRRLRRAGADPSLRPSESRVGILLDLETTGLDHGKHEVIELAMLKFYYSADDNVLFPCSTFQSFNQPSTPIPAEVQELTGITDDMVQGHTIGERDVAQFVADANVVIAHNAAFDRKFSERLSPVFERMAWACSMSEVPWKEIGFSSAKLPHILMESGFFHDAHRALDDCYALLHILSRPVNGASGTTLRALLQQARKSTHRIYAEGAPYDLKDVLKRRGYKWGDGSDGSPRAWYIDLSEGLQEAEISFLTREIYQCERDVLVRSFTALERFSGRQQ